MTCGLIISVRCDIAVLKPPVNLPDCYQQRANCFEVIPQLEHATSPMASERTPESVATAGEPTVLVVLINYCTPDLTIDCLRSLEGEVARYPGSSVVVADNASPDGSGAAVARVIEENGWHAWARLLALPRNGGFAYGNNAVVREQLESSSPPSYVWLLNTDTLVRPGALHALVAFLQKNPFAGIVGSRLEHEDGSRQCSAFRFPSIGGELESSSQIGIISRLMKAWAVAPQLPDEPRKFDWLSGASMLVRTTVFQSVGLMDEGYFLYYEETDFCRRAKTASWSCWYVPQSRVVHLVGKSTGVTDFNRRTKRRPSYWFQSRRRYFIKHHGFVYALMADLALAVGTLLSKLRSTLKGQRAAEPRRFLRDLARHSALWDRYD